MALRIEWSIEAKENLSHIIHYLEVKWTEREVRKFVRTLEEQLEIISKTPFIYKKSQRMDGTRECLLSKHNSLLYVFNEDALYIVTIWDNHRDPKKMRAEL